MNESTHGTGAIRPQTGGVVRCAARVSRYPYRDRIVTGVNG